MDCRPEGSGWTCTVTVEEAGGWTRHEVTVARADLERLEPGAAEPSRLVRQSFTFLLEREPKEAILRTFELPVIGRYFPGYEEEIVRRLGRSKGR